MPPFLVKELKRCNISIAGISETRWFGSKEYDIDGFKFLSSGRVVPDLAAGDLADRGEGVGIVMDKKKNT